MGWGSGSHQPMLTSMWERCTASWDLGVAERATRESRGDQPALPFVTYDFLLWANVTYYSVTLVLWLVMRQREKGFKDVLRPVMILYNAICVLLAGAVVFGIAHHKLFVDQGKFVCNEEQHTTRFRSVWIGVGGHLYEHDIVKLQTLDALDLGDFDAWGKRELVIENPPESRNFASIQTVEVQGRVDGASGQYCNAGERLGSLKVTQGVSEKSHRSAVIGEAEQLDGGTISRHQWGFVLGKLSQ